MTLEEYKRQQRASLKEFRAKVAGSGRAQAVNEARDRLRAAKIIDGNGNLTKHYR